MYLAPVMVGSGKRAERVAGAVMNRTIRIAALAGLVVLTAAGADAQGWYNTNGFGLSDPATPPFQASTNSYSGFYRDADGLLRSGTVNAWSMNLGSGVSVQMFTQFSNTPAVNFSGFGGNGFVQNFPGSVPTDFVNRPYFDAAGGPSNVAGQVSVGLGGGLSMNFMGGLSRQPGAGFYFGPGSAFSNRTYTTVGTGFSLNLGRGGTLSVTGSMSSGPRGYGYGFP